tara:strand:- start:5000 stop:5842 length:843 start_codon:yes stop_codon:yes gene_type:complete
MKKIINKSKSLLKPPWNSPRNKTSLNLLTTFSSFKPHGNQSYEAFVPLVIKNINEIIPAISKIVELENQDPIIPYSVFCEGNKNKNSKVIEEELIKNLEHRGSDKVAHNYHLIYSCLFSDLNLDYKILEIGLGTNNPKLVSSMGVGGMPGASVKAFRDTFSKALVYGADVDREILFKEERIETYYVDQNDLKTFDNIINQVKDKFDLIIDDGLHYQLSNLNTLIFALSNLRNNGYFVIEDIGIWTIETWKIVNNILPSNFESKIIQMSETNFIFLVKKLS